MAGSSAYRPRATSNEFGHAVVAALGWEVERINLCLPGGGVEYSHVGTWAGNAQGYAGGIAAALFLFALYAIAFSRRKRPLHSPLWRAAGLGTVVFIGPQLPIALLEGVAGRGEDYTERLREGSRGLRAAPGGFGARGCCGVHTRRWRSVWRRGDTGSLQVRRIG